VGIVASTTLFIDRRTCRRGQIAKRIVDSLRARARTRHMLASSLFDLERPRHHRMSIARASRRPGGLYESGPYRRRSAFVMPVRRFRSELEFSPGVSPR